MFKNDGVTDDLPELRRRFSRAFGKGVRGSRDAKRPRKPLSTNSKFRNVAKQKVAKAVAAARTGRRSMSSADD